MFSKFGVNFNGRLWNLLLLQLPSLATIFSLSSCILLGIDIKKIISFCTFDYKLTFLIRAIKLLCQYVEALYNVRTASEYFYFKPLYSDILDI